MATKRTSKERVQNPTDLFEDELGTKCLENTEPLWGYSKSPHRKKARKSPYPFGTGSRNGKELEGRVKSNSRLWASLYPTPKK